MKLDFQAKFLQHLNKRKRQEEGFTLIELLVVIIIIGILAAIALPSLLSQVNKGKQAEAKQNVGSMNRTQQAYFLENDEFATNVTFLGVGIKTQTVNFNYSITTSTGTNAAGDTFVNAANNRGISRGSSLKSYVGLNYTTESQDDTKEPLTIAFVCETIKTGKEGADAVDAEPPVPPGTTDAKCDDTKYKDLGGTKKGTAQ